ncbi:winged helix-turn-helix domain-containing protein [Qipengyuania nanhaisediminis]|uniref:winged helix-turn-helix domain-containing protein n=1 Tax=Qipengyuania nanhaisediminis TaxID=604088 RepID=UPI0038B24155
MTMAPQRENADSEQGRLNIGPITADFDAAEISGNGHTIRLEPVVAALLVAFTETPGAVLSRGHLIDRVWGNRFGSDESLSRAISLLRKAIRSCGVERNLIETVPKRGYRLAEPVRPLAQEAPAPPPALATGQHLTSIGIMPFTSAGEAPLLDIGAEIADGLSRFSWLRPRRASGTSSETRFRLEGRHWQSSGQIKITVRLIDQLDEAIIWSRTYEAPLDDSSDPYAAIEAITHTIIASLGDQHGRMMATAFAGIASGKSDAALGSAEAVVRTFLFKERVNEEDHLETREALERAREHAPGSADVWAASAYIAIEEHKHEFNPLPGSTDRALEMARRAIQIDPRNAYAQFCLAEVHFFRREYGSFKSAANKAIDLNPYDSDAMAMIGIMMTYGGDRERGVELSLRAMALNPDHPGWYRFAHIFADLIAGDYERAIEWAEMVQMPLYYADPYVRAIVLGLMGREDEAKAALGEMLALWGDDLTGFREKAIERWTYRSPELQDLFARGLELAGMDLSDAN